MEKHQKVIHSQNPYAVGIQACFLSKPAALGWLDADQNLELGGLIGLYWKEAWKNVIPAPHQF